MIFSCQSSEASNQDLVSPLEGYPAPYRLCQKSSSLQIWSLVTLFMFKCTPGLGDVYKLLTFKASCSLNRVTQDFSCKRFSALQKAPYQTFFSTYKGPVFIQHHLFIVYNYCKRLHARLNMSDSKWMIVSDSQGKISCFEVLLTMMRRSTRSLARSFDFSF